MRYGWIPYHSPVNRYSYTQFTRAPSVRPDADTVCGCEGSGPISSTISISGALLDDRHHRIVRARVERVINPGVAAGDGKLGGHHKIVEELVLYYTQSRDFSRLPARRNPCHHSA